MGTGYEQAYPFFFRGQRIGEAVNQQNPEVRVVDTVIVIKAKELARVCVLRQEESSGHAVEYRLDEVVDVQFLLRMSMETKLERDHVEISRIPLGFASHILYGARHFLFSVPKRSFLLLIWGGVDDGTLYRCGDRLRLLSKLDHPGAQREVCF